MTTRSPEQTAERVTAPGPVEQTLNAIIEDTIGDGSAGRINAEFLPDSRVGPFRIHLEPILGDKSLDPIACGRVASALARCPGIARATGVPPRVYLRVTDEMLYESVVRAIVRDPARFGDASAGAGRTVLVGFSDPNVNKPLHLGHLRNNFIGMALSNLFEAGGYAVQREATHTDWGIHICQALVGYERWARETTPLSSAAKGDQFVGEFYVRFHRESTGEAEAAAAEVLRTLSTGSDLWLTGKYRQLVRWADDGIRETYRRIGTRMDRIFYESDYVSACEDILQEGLAQGIWQYRPDGSIYADLTDAGLGEVTLARRDGTPVVYAQWIAVDRHRFGRRQFSNAVLLMGAEWQSGLRVHLELLRRLGSAWVERTEPIYYGMVNLPEGRIKSRHGTGVAADIVLDQLAEALLRSARGASSWGTMAADGAAAETLALALTKYAMLRVRRQHDVIYEERVLLDKTLRGLTSLLRALAQMEQAGGSERPMSATGSRRATRAVNDVLLRLNGFPTAVQSALTRRDPSLLVRYLDGLGRATLELHRHGVREEGIGAATAHALRRGFAILNIDLPRSLPDGAEPSLSRGRRPSA
jgi:arginyl-tRNA synthetase